MGPQVWPLLDEPDTGQIIAALCTQILHLGCGVGLVLDPEPCPASTYTKDFAINILNPTIPTSVIGVPVLASNPSSSTILALQRNDVSLENSKVQVLSHCLTAI